MQLFVKSAHIVNRTYNAFDVTCSNIRRHASELTIEPKLAIWAAKKFLMDMKKAKKAGIDTSPFCNSDSIFSEFSTKDRQIVAVCLSRGIRSKLVRRSVTLTVEPTMTIGALKSILKSHHWIPKENLVLVDPRGSRPLEDRNSTIDEYGIKDGNTLLTCMGGSFPVRVQNLIYNEMFINVSSCFSTIGDLKDKIHQRMGYPPEAQDLSYRRKLLVDQDGTPLVSLGIVSPFIREILHPLSLSVANQMVEGLIYC